jgi:hypothetical protein
VLEFLLLETFVQVLRDHCLNADPILSIQWVVFAIALVIHVVSSDVPSDFGVLVRTFQFSPLWVLIVLEGDGIVGEAILAKEYPLVLAVLLMPIIWFTPLYSSRSFSFC